MYSRLNFGLPHPVLAGSLELARRIGVRAQFGDALLALRAALGRIGIRPQICCRRGINEACRGLRSLIETGTGGLSVVIFFIATSACSIRSGR